MVNSTKVNSQSRAKSNASNTSLTLTTNKIDNRKNTKQSVRANLEHAIPKTILPSRSDSNHSAKSGISQSDSEDKNNTHKHVDVNTKLN